MLGLVPTYWPARCFWALLGGEAGWWAYWLAGVLIQVFITTGLMLTRLEAIAVMGVYGYFVAAHLWPSIVPWHF